MTVQLHIAMRENRKAFIHPLRRPVIFSAGPIRNAPVWQNEAMRIAVQRGENIFFASPLRDGEDGFASGLKKHLAPMYGLVDFPRQRAWEQYYLNRAGESGCVFFWLAAPLPRDEWKWPEKSYAQITMLELGTCIERENQFPSNRLVVGAEDGFPELSTIRYEIETVLPSLTVHSSLEETVNTAIDVAIA